MNIQPIQPTNFKRNSQAFKSRLATTGMFKSYCKSLHGMEPDIFEQEFFHLAKIIEPQGNPHHKIMVTLTEEAEKALLEYKKPVEPAAEMYLSYPLWDKSEIVLTDVIPLNVKENITRIHAKIGEIADFLMKGVKS